MVTFGLTQFTKLAIDSIRATVKNPYEIFVVVGKPGDSETLNWLATEPNIKFKVHTENMGFPSSLNDIYDYAWKENNYDNLILLGNDVILYPYAGDSLINFANETDYKIVSALQYDVRDLIKDYPETAKYFRGDRFIIEDFSGKPWENFTGYSENIVVDDMRLYDIQNLCLYKRDVFDTIGYTDKLFPAYFVDNNYAKKFLWHV
jgi:GT2 family glycosyltransferase